LKDRGSCERTWLPFFSHYFLGALWNGNYSSIFKKEEIMDARKLGLLGLGLSIGSVIANSMQANEIEKEREAKEKFMESRVRYLESLMNNKTEE